MKQYLFICLSILVAATVSAQPINEEKVKKAADIMASMIANPDQMMSLYPQMQALKLTPAEEKEAQKRAQQQAINSTKKMVDEAAATGGKSMEQVKQMRETNKRIVPIKDEARINAVVKRTLSDGEIKSYCKAVHESIKKTMLPQAVEQAEKLFSQIKSKASAPEAQGKEAIAAYLANLTLQSLYIMGRICSESNADANTLNNYAALLNSVRMEHGSIPILNYLRTKYGASPPVMNNLAMAWLGLGEFQKAGKIADTVIQRFPGRRGQAHYVKSIIKEGEGDRKGAIEQMEKSLDESYSMQKENLLSKWGVDPSGRIRISKDGPDVLGLSKFAYPKFPKSFGELVQDKQTWDQYSADYGAALDRAWEKFYKLDDEWKQKQMRKSGNTVSSMSSGYAYSISNAMNRKMSLLHSSYKEAYAEVDRELIRRLDTVQKKVRQLRFELDSTLKEIRERLATACKGMESMYCPAICEADKNAYDLFLKKANEEWEKYYEYAFIQRVRHINHIVDASQYVLEPDYLQVAVAKEGVDFMAFMKSIHIELAGPWNGSSEMKSCMMGVKEKPIKARPLPDFDEVNCKNKWFMAFPGGHELSTECNKLTFKVNFGFASVARTENLVTGEWNEFEIEAGFDVGSKHWLEGALEAGAEAGGYVKIDRSGVNDWGVKAGSSIKAGGVKAIELSKKVSMVSGKSEVEITSDFSSSKIEWK